jgi:hypothetical protein
MLALSWQWIFTGCVSPRKLRTYSSTGFEKVRPFEKNDDTAISVALYDNRFHTEKRLLKADRADPDLLIGSEKAEGRRFCAKR